MGFPLCLQEDDLVVDFLCGFGLGYRFEAFDDFACGQFLLVNVYYAWELFLDGYFYEVCVMREYHCLFLDGNFNLLFVSQA